MAYPPSPPPYDRGTGPGYQPYDRGTAPGYQPYDRGFGPVPREHPDATTVLVLGILGLVLCSICAPFAWSKGNNALAEIDRNPMAYSNRSTVQIGRILGIVGSCYAVFQIVVGVIWIAALSAATSGTT